MTIHKFLEHELIENDKCNWEFFGLLSICLGSMKPDLTDKRERWSYVANKLGFPSPCVADEYLNGLDNLYKKLKVWSETDRKIYWKYMDAIGDCLTVFTDETITFKYKGNDVILAPK